MKSVVFKKTRWFTVITTLCLVAVTLFAFGGCGKYEKPESKPEKFEIEHVKTELGGCNIQQYDLNRGSMEIENDTVIITISEDSINVFVGFKFTCKVEPFETQVEIIDDILYMYIKDICYDYDGNEVNCGYERCYCYYTFDFVFNYDGAINQKYKILLYKGLLLGDEEPISIISEGIINFRNR
jgi:hypothetical protein